MSITINIRHNFPEVSAQLDRLAKDVGDKAMRSALNATVRQGNTAMARQISKEFRVTVKQAKDRLVVDYARNKGNLELKVSLSATRPVGFDGSQRGMNIIHFVTRLPTRRKNGKLGQLMFQIKRTGGQKYYKGAFVATNRKTGGRSVFVRLDKARLPIAALTTIDVPIMFNTRRINSVVRQIMLDRFKINFRRQLRAVTKGFLK